MKSPEPAEQKAVLFSLGALLGCEDASDAAAAAFQQVVVRFGIAGDTSRKFGLFCSRFAQAARWYEVQRFYLQRDRLRGARAAGVRALGVHLSLADQDELDAIWLASHAGTRPRPEAYALLERLRDSGLKVGIISNADCDEFEAKLAGTRFPQLADVLLCSEAAGSCKPDPVIYYEALKRLDVRPLEACLVGTSVETDIRGAAVVGMRSVLLSGRARHWWDQPDTQPATVVSTLNEVATLVTLPAPAGGPRVRRRANPPGVVLAGR
jgi:FMN phosphatase YigB (HAD superfamily)